MMTKVCILGALMLFTSSSVAQGPSFRCKFSHGQVTNFDNGRPVTERDTGMGEFVLDQINTKDATARLIGNAGTETLRVLDGGDLVHLVEVTGAGNMNITTIYNFRDKNKGTLPAVHSRHIGLLGDPMPSQYVGLCQRM